MWIYKESIGNLEGHKIVTIWKSVVFFCLSNDILENKISTIYSSIKNVKYIRMHFTEHAQIFYTAATKLLLRELTEVVNKWWYIYHARVED